MLDLRENLNEEWVWFQEVVLDCDTMLKQEKEKFKNNLATSHQEFKVKIMHIVDDFNRKGLHKNVRFSRRSHLDVGAVVILPSSLCCRSILQLHGL